MKNSEAIFETSVPGLQVIARGKVRDIYAVDDEHLLIVTTDRLVCLRRRDARPGARQGRSADRVVKLLVRDDGRPDPQSPDKEIADLRY